MGGKVDRVVADTSVDNSADTCRVCGRAGGVKVDLLFHDEGDSDLIQGRMPVHPDCVWLALGRAESPLARRQRESRVAAMLAGVKS